MLFDAEYARNGKIASVKSLREWYINLTGASLSLLEAKQMVEAIQEGCNRSSGVTYTDLTNEIAELRKSVETLESQLRTEMNINAMLSDNLTKGDLVSLIRKLLD